LAPADMKKYPKLAYYVRVNIPQVINVPAIVKAFKKIGGIDRPTMKAALHWGALPSITVTDLVAALGEFTPDSGSNEIPVDTKVVKDFGAGEGVRVAQAERTLFWFRTNERILDSIMAVQRLGQGQGQGLVRGLAARSRYPLPEAEVERFNGLCVGAIHHLLARGRRSTYQRADPTGREALRRADRLRGKLRALRRCGQLTDAIVAWLRGLSPAA
jgi:hypothetical protein